MKNVVLVVVAHSDDEVISMGGAIRKHIEKGDTVVVIAMTNGVGARDNFSEGDILDRERASKMASSILGYKWGVSCDFSDNKMDTYALLEVVKSIEVAKEKYKPDLVYTHSAADLNIDHKIVANAVLTAFRPHPGQICREIRLFETASATDYGHPSITGTFLPNLFIEINETWKFKLKALEAYKTEMREYPHSRSLLAIENLAKIRGNQVGLEMAEAFQVIRKLV